MKRNIITTADGSKTIQIEAWNEQYHSTHGAIQEAKHVFIKHGLDYVVSNYSQKQVDILEIGFGTGLNTYITLIEAKKNKLTINYDGVEAYPVVPEELKQLNYSDQLSNEQFSDIFEKLHSVPWEIQHRITSYFYLIKRKLLFSEINDKASYDLIYFDAFGARVQPELWTESMFQIMYKALRKKGVLVTYSAKGSVRRAMQSVGFKVERLPGPPGKREMLRACKEV